MEIPPQGRMTIQSLHSDSPPQNFGGNHSLTTNKPAEESPCFSLVGPEHIHFCKIQIQFPKPLPRTTLQVYLQR